jgi:hypothetical protein
MYVHICIFSADIFWSCGIISDDTEETGVVGDRIPTGCRGPFLTSPLGANFDPQGRSCPPEVSLSPGGEILCSPLHSSKQ